MRPDPFIFLRWFLATLLVVFCGCGWVRHGRDDRKSADVPAIDHSICSLAILAALKDSTGLPRADLLQVQKVALPWTGDRSVESIIGREWLMACPYTKDFKESIALIADKADVLDCKVVSESILDSKLVEQVACDEYDDPKFGQGELLTSVTIPAYSADGSKCVVGVILGAGRLSGSLYVIELRRDASGWIVVNRGVNILAIS